MTLIGNTSYHNFTHWRVYKSDKNPDEETFYLSQEKTHWSNNKGVLSFC